MAFSYSIPGFRDKALAALNHVPGFGASSPEIDSYSKDYEVILRWFSEQKSWTCNSVRLGGLMVYGWMPTILRSEGRDKSPRPNEYCKIKEKLNRNEIGATDYKFLNNSVSGTSKFLHFWKPDRFPIWNKNVRRALCQPEHYEPTKQYVLYLDDICLLSKETSKTIREIELALFRCGKMKTSASSERAKDETR